VGAGPGRIALVLALLAGCLPLPERSERDGAGGGAVVLDGEDLRRAGGMLLDALRARVPNLRVARRRGECPLVSIRGQRTLHASEDPSIYVDGSAAKDTCILEHIRVIDVDRVEVYTSGSTTLPGYRGNPNGLILVFLIG
jgi:hypothetical protein